MKIEIEVDKEKIDETLNNVRELKENFLEWALENESPAQYPDDVFLHLKALNNIDKLVLSINKSIEKESEPK